MTKEISQVPVNVFSAVRTREEEVAPKLYDAKRKLRHLWLVRATESHEVFEELGKKVVADIRRNPLWSYPEFADAAQARLATPYTETETEHSMFKVEKDIELPESAQSFEIQDRSGNTRKVAKFRDAARKKIAADFPWNKPYLYELYRNDVAFRKEDEIKLFDLLDEVAEGDVRIFSEALFAYASVDQKLLGLLGETLERVKRLPSLRGQKKGMINGLKNKVLSKNNNNNVGHKDPEVYYGRDARWLYLARKAQQVGLAQQNRLYYIVASRSILESDAFKEYVQDQHIPFEAYHIDTAVNSSHAIKVVLDILAKQNGKTSNKDDFIKKGRFIVTSLTEKKHQLFPERDSALFWEDVMLKIESRIQGLPPEIFRRYPSGRLEPDFMPIGIPYIEKLRAWAMDQAVVRHFLSKTTTYS